MLLIKTYLDKSSIHGIGVFTDEFIKKGTVVWEFNPLVDVILTEKQLNELPEVTRKFIEDHGFPYPFGANNHCLSLDHAQYMNHSDTPNIDGAGDKNVALQDIPKGTELTDNYYLYEHRANELEKITLTIS